MTLAKKVMASKSKSKGERKDFPALNICSCRDCDHELARDCAKKGCDCCSKESHLMILDGMAGFYPVDRG